MANGINGRALEWAQVLIPLIIGLAGVMIAWGSLSTQMTYIERDVSELRRQLQAHISLSGHPPLETQLEHIEKEINRIRGGASSNTP